MKKYLIVFLGVFIILGNTNIIRGQEVLDGIYIKNHTKEKKPLPYQYVRESDVMWSKTIWRRIDLREKMNLDLYYPTKPTDGRMSLIDLLMWGIKNEGLQAYKYNAGDEFGAVMTMKEIEETLGARTDTSNVEDVQTGVITKKAVTKPPDLREIKQFQVKELWFFDKQRSVMEVRIIGIGPIREYFKEDDKDQEDPKYAEAFWIYFPEARKILANHEVFNSQNDAQRTSFDDIFQKRLFNGYIAQESNMYNNRLISEYTIGLESLLEAERIKESIFNFEQDLWEY
jgi:gliding motility associated protien GldN